MDLERVMLARKSGSRTSLLLHPYDGLSRPFLWDDYIEFLQPLAKALQRKVRKGDIILGLDGPGQLPAGALASLLKLPVAFATKIHLARENAIELEEAQSERPQIFIYGLKPKMRVVIVDEATDTGGTLVSAITRIEEAGCEVVAAAVLFEARKHGAHQKVHDLGHELISAHPHQL
jgi:adenine/guanine phosphoribosyltransferase-like PRPP-binding protein